MVLALLAALTSIAVTGYDKPAVDKAVFDRALYSNLDNFGEAISILRDEYVEPVDSKNLIHGAMKGMLSSLDEYSHFLEKNEYEELESDAVGEFGGLGIEVSTKDGTLTVVTPLDGSPAEKAGIRPGDKVVKIDNKTTEGMAITEAVDRMRGDPGTVVTLTIWRDKHDKVFDIPLRRATIKMMSIKKAELLEGDVGYIKLVEFQSNTPHDLDEALRKLEKEGMKSIILDLRNNPGGLLETASDVAERFLPKDKVVVSIKSRLPEDSGIFKSSGSFTLKDYPMAVLVNGGSASASEVVAGAIQDNKRGKVIGARTFGKASVQTVAQLKDGSAIRFTSAYYYTPSGKLIKKDGIVPDIIIESDGMDAPDAKKDRQSGKKDEQLEAALKYLGALKSHAKQK